MNSFGKSFRVSVLGESHGNCVGVLIDGCPAGVSLTPEEFEADLARRRAGAKGTTPRTEADIPILQTGVFNGFTTGAPLLILFPNANIRSGDYEELKRTPRPGHADFVAYEKFKGFQDYRGGGHFSGRLTVALTAAGVIAKKVISPVTVSASLDEVHGSTDIQREIELALGSGDSVGGIVSCTVSNVPTGLGEPFFDSVESLIAHGVFSIPAIKGVEFGAGFASARMFGSECNDSIIDLSGATATNHAGGINGGITNGNQITFRVAVKPTSSIRKERSTVNLDSGERVALSVGGRHDACIALRVPPVLEGITAVVLADLLIQEQRIPRVVKADA
jgi:chorismate synthase